MRKALYYFFVALILVGTVILVLKIYSLEKIPDHDTFALHLNNIRRGIEKAKSDWRESYAWTSERRKLQNPRVQKALWTLDKIILYTDTAEFYFNRLDNSKNNLDSARYYYEQYRLFSVRFEREMEVHLELKTDNYVFDLHENLPGGKIPFESSHDRELIALLLQDEFYRFVQQACDKIYSIIG